MVTLGTAPIGPKALARTYSPPSYNDPWECIEDYFRVTEYADSHPDTGSSAMSNALELPRGRVRSWIEGSKPDAVRGIEVAEDRGWLGPETGSPVFRGLNVFVAWIFSGGSISQETFSPYFVADRRRDGELLRRAASVTGVDLVATRPKSQERARELRPRDNESVLGRVLAVLGAPIGGKNSQSRVSLPPYLQDAPQKPRQEFAAVYLRNRANPVASGPIRFREERSRRYLLSLAQFFRGVTGQEVTLSEKNVLLSQRAAESVRTWPEPLREYS